MGFNDWELIAGNNSGPYREGKPEKIVLHRTQGRSVEGAVATYRVNNSWPHCTIDFGRFSNSVRRVRHVPLSVASRALRNEIGGVETNREGVVNVEVVGFSAYGPGDFNQFTQSEAIWLRDYVLAVLLQETGIPNNWTENWRWQVGNKGYGSDKPQRLTREAWKNFRGITCHAQVPENSHWDIGYVDNSTLMLLKGPTGVIVFPELPQLKDDEVFRDAIELVENAFQTYPVNKRLPDQSALNSYAGQIALKAQSGLWAQAVERYAELVHDLQNE